MVLVVDHDQDLPLEHRVFQPRGLVDRHTAADEGAGDRAATTPGHLDVLPQIAGTEHGAEAGNRGRLHFAQPIQQLAETAVVNGGVLDIVQGAGQVLERLGVSRRAAHNAYRMGVDTAGFELADGVTRRQGAGEDAGRRHDGNYSNAA